MAEHFQTLLGSIVANPDQRLSALELLSPAERSSLLSDGMVAGVEEICACTLDQLFAEQVIRTPDAIALVGEEEQLSYAELDARASLLARFLQQQGVGPEVCVGVCLQRSPALLIALLAVLKAGGAYVPLDPTAPPERLAWILRDTQAPLLLTQEALLSILPTSYLQVLCLERDWPRLAEAELVPLQSLAGPESLAYVIYTSGSTGQPKGVAVPHRALSAFTQSAQRLFGLQPSERVLQFASASFDASAEEIYPCLSSGATLVLRTEAMLSGPTHFFQLCEQWGLSVLDLPTAYWHELALGLEHAEVQVPTCLRLLIIGGEAALPEPLARWQRQVGERIRLLNTYGPTETTVVATVQPVAAQAELAAQQARVIGRPLPHARAYVLDGSQQVVPQQVAGELSLGGAGVARGYLGRPELTAEYFVPDPFSAEPGARLYRSGDRARWLAGEEGARVLEYQGRSDRQAKLRGYRIELGEIEAALNQHPNVREGVVVLREDVPGDKRLVAYIIAEQATPDLGHQLRAFLQLQLPAYMLPTAFVLLDTLPLTSHGKIDYRALPAPEWRRGEDTGDDNIRNLPRTPTEELLASIWTQVLRVEHIRRHDQFFDLGGHSLLATQVVARVRELFGVEMPLRMLFDTPTLTGLAEVLDTAHLEGQLLQLPTLRAYPRGSELPLSYAQQRLWFLDQFEPDNPSYNIPLALHLTGQLEVAALQDSLDVLVRRHESLRTTFVAREGRPAQIIAPPCRLELPLIDLSEGEIGEHEWRRLAQQEAQRPFNLAADPLLRVYLLRLGAEDHVLLLTLHHIITDAWSIDILVRELAISYRAALQRKEPALPELSLQYADIALWQRQWLEDRGEGESSPLGQQLAYWHAQLDGAPPLLELPTDHPRPSIQTFHGAHHLFQVPAHLTTELRRLSQQEGVTLFMTLLTAFQMLLSRYSGQEDIVVGTPIANRRYAAMEDVMGFFVNTLAMRTRLHREWSSRELLRRVREIALEAYAHQDLPFEKLVDALHPERTLSHPPLFQVMFVLQNGSSASLDLPNLQVSLLPVESGIARFDLTLTMNEGAEQMQGVLEYNQDLFEPATIARLAGHLLTLLEGMVAHPESPLTHLPLLPSAEWQQLIQDWNATATDAPLQQSVVQVFEAQVQRTPHAIALSFADEQLSYHDLNARANRLAHALRTLGIGLETPVGLCLERCPEMVVGMLGILKAGACYVPLDPGYPPERLAFMLQDAHISLVLTRQRGEGAASVLASVSAPAVRLLDLEADWPWIAQHSPENPPCPTQGAHLAYLMYTSGSTGQPKGVQIAHRSIVRLVCDVAYVHLDARQRLLQMAPISFDAATFELWGALLHGGRCVLFPTDLPAVHELGAVLAREQISTLWLTASLFNVVIEEAPEVLAGLRQLLIGGEALSVSHVRRALQALPQVQIINGYGPTENTTFSCCFPLDRALPEDTRSIPIGPPIAQTQVYVLDASGQPVPLGVVGELYLGGAGLARGYLDRPALTAERFAPHPFSAQPGERLYRTGDLVRWLANGHLEFVGRRDHQVKLRGFRVELGEIEAVLQHAPGVAEAVVVLRTETAGEKRLVAYVVASSGQEVAPAELQAHLASRLPAYMVPASILLLPALPLTPNGKLDRRALPAPLPPQARPEDSTEVPATATERALAAIWQQVLGLAQVGRHDNFFALGGDSILSIQIVARATAAGLPLTPKQLFQAQTIAELAALVEASAPLRQVEQGPVSGSVPLTAIQHWFFQQELAEPQHWNQAILLQVMQPLSPGVLQQALHALLWQHDALRLRARSTPSGWHLEHAPVPTLTEVPFCCVDMSLLDPSAQSLALQEWATALQASLDLEQGPLLRLALFPMGEARPARLLLLIHHLVVDIVSWQILLADLQVACQQRLRGQPVQLAAKTTSWKQWAEGMQTYAQSSEVHRHLDFWLSQPWDRVAPLPRDYSEEIASANLEGSARTLEVILSQEETEALLTQVPQVYHTQMPEVLLTALLLACAPWTGRSGLLVHLEGHGREEVLADVDVSRTVGWFTTLVPLVLSVPEAAGGDVGETLQQVKEQVRRVPQHGLSFGLLRYLCQEQDVQQRLAGLPKPEIVFNYGGRATRVLAQEEERLFAAAPEEAGEVRSPRGQRVHLLEINAGIAQDRLYLEWTYSQHVHRAETIQRVAQAYLEALQALIVHCQSPEAGGYTPSDFPLAQLDEQKLRELSLFISEIDQS